MRFLLATWEGGGVVPPEMGVVRRLRTRGHQVRVLADPAVEAAARAAGAEFSPWIRAPFKRSLAPEEDFLRDWEYKNLLKLFAHALEVFLCGPADRFAADTIEVLDLVLREANDLKDYINSGKQADAQAYDSSRKKALKEIKTLLSIKD